MALGLPNTARNGSPSYELGRLRTPQAFDVVTLWDVIEHVEDPAELLVRVRERLRPDGFVVIETGNYLSAGRIEMGAQWWCNQVDHRWYFSPDTCMQLLEQVGFGEFELERRAPRARGQRQAAAMKVHPVRNRARL